MRARLGWVEGKMYKGLRVEWSGRGMCRRGLGLDGLGPKDDVEGAEGWVGVERDVGSRG